MMMPAVWWSATLAARQRREARQAESATFIRKVPEPQRQLRMRRRKSAASAPSGDHRRVEQLAD